MNKYTKIAIIGAVVILLVTLLYFFGLKDRDTAYSTDSWEKTFSPEDKGPYGTYVLKELLDTAGLFGDFLELDEDLDVQLEDNPDENDIYFFVGGKNYLSDSSAQFLLNFVKEGNTAFIATEFFPNELLDEICFDRDWIFESEPVEDSVQHFKFLNAQLSQKRYSFNYIYNNEIKLKTWFYFDQKGFDLEINGAVYPLGSNVKDKWNFIQIDWGDGSLFLHSQPYLFTNIVMMKRDGFQYIENVLKHVPPGRVQWDKYNLNYHNESDEEGDGEERRSILEFIMNNPPLMWAFLILVFGAILYALFKGKRMQKIVPAQASKDNMSLQYIGTLSSLYMKEKRHNKLIKLKEKTFLNFIAERYYIHCNTPDEKFINKLVLKSHVPKKELIELFNLFKKLEKSTAVSDEALIFLHKKIEKFYKTCR